MNVLTPSLPVPVARAGERPRILHIFRAPLGGLFRHVLDVTRAQVARGYDVGIFCDSTTGGTRADAALDDLRPSLTLGVTRVPMRRNPNLTDLTALSALQGLRHRTRPTVLHGHGSKGAAYARLATSRSLDPVTIRAYTPHGGSFNYRPGTPLHRLYMTVERALARRTDVFLFESAYIAGRFRAYVGETRQLTRIVPNGVSEAEFEPIGREDEAFDLVYVGEMRQAKGVDTLIDALAFARREHGRRLTLLAVGSGPDEAALQAHAVAAGVADAITFEPPQAIRGALGRGRVMVIPSRAESLPYVILEAAAAAQPMVATDVGGIPEIFGPFADELIRPDRVPALAEALLRKLAESPEARQAKAEALTSFVRTRFALDTMVDGVLGGYEAAFARRGIPVVSRP